MEKGQAVYLQWALQMEQQAGEQGLDRWKTARQGALAATITAIITS